MDELIRRGQDALMAKETWQRYRAKAELDEARAALPVAVRGYDRGQVDALLEELSATLARWGDEDAKPA
ncbi:DivIVA domain-containing protein [Micromonospora sp. CPCC 205561]|uniref:DivIVA domain-containing protein n=1 Tax=Micromonospora sp. CPCC 205561 TaxID=3122407 RepID=UPI002FF011F9